VIPNPGIPGGFTGNPTGKLIAKVLGLIKPPAGARLASGVRGGGGSSSSPVMSVESS